MELDFTNRVVLVVGGSSGIGNGIAQAFRAHGASVHVWGTRASAADYRKEEGSDLEGLTYAMETFDGYRELLLDAGFADVELADATDWYRRP